MSTQPDRCQTAIASLRFVLRRAEDALFAVANCAAFGAIASNSVQDGDIHMPGALLQLNPPVTTHSLATQFPRWIAGIAFREYITQFGGFLEEIVCVISLTEQFQQPGDEWNIQAEWERINRMSFPDKLKRLEEETQSCLPPGLRQDIESINRARNCFEHRRGMVTQRDAPSGSLDVSWRTMQFLEKRMDGQEIAIETLPYETEIGSSIIHRVAQRQKPFTIGSVLEFTGPEIWEIGVSLVVGAKEITAMVERFAKPIVSGAHEPHATTDPHMPMNGGDIKHARFEMNLYPDRKS